MYANLNYSVGDFICVRIGEFDSSRNGTCTIHCLKASIMIIEAVVYPYGSSSITFVVEGIVYTYYSK